MPCASADGVPLALCADLEAALAILIPDPFHLFDVFQSAGLHLRLFAEPAQGRRFESVAQCLPAVGAVAEVPLPLDAPDAGGFVEGNVPALAVAVDLGPLDLEAGLQSVVPDGAVPAVADPSVCRRPPDGQGDHVTVEAVADVAPAKPALEENPDDFEAVGEVDVRDFSLRTVHGVGEDGVPLIQELGDLLGVRVANVLLFHGVFLSGLSALSI